MRFKKNCEIRNRPNPVCLNSSPDPQMGYGGEQNLDSLRILSVKQLEPLASHDENSAAPKLVDHADIGASLKI